MILEGIVTTLNADDGPNISPMGPIVNENFGRAEQTEQYERLILRPYQTSTTFANLKRTGQGVFHVTDDVLLLAQAAVGRPEPLPPLVPAEAIDGLILVNTCRWYAFRVREIDDRQPRTQIVAEVVDRGRVRDFFGFNRAKHAVVEAAILATRVALLPRAEIEAELARLTVVVEKTGGPREHEAMTFLRDFIHHAPAPPRV